MTARLYGKLPAHGDFVSRGFTREVTESYDAWLSASLADARAVHGDAFEARYDRALPWRFARGGTGGAITPSQDMAGRRFPIFVLLDNPAPLTTAEAIEDLLYKAIAGRWTADTLIAAVGALDVPCEREPLRGSGRWFLAGETTTLTGSQPAELLTHMLAVGADA